MLEAGLWGLFAGSSLLLGAVAGLVLRLPRHLVAAIMGFGAGVLISAVAFELTEEEWQEWEQLRNSNPQSAIAHLQSFEDFYRIALRRNRSRRSISYAAARRRSSARTGRWGLRSRRMRLNISRSIFPAPGVIRPMSS